MKGKEHKKMPLPKEEYYTYADYAEWSDDARYELIEGAPYLMSPAPTSAHQRISMELSGQFWAFLKDKSCQIFTAPFDVRLNAGAEDDTVVQPDILIVCDKTKIDSAGCVGVPDMVVEILSPSTAGYDRFRKYSLYQQYGVAEYWIVDPETKGVEVHVLNKDGLYVKRVFGEEDEAPVSILDGCTIRLAEVFGSWAVQK
jgi:Uma2 family endonuclease